MTHKKKVSPQKLKRKIKKLNGAGKYLVTKESQEVIDRMNKIQH